jgi:hypothetical protein
MAAVRNLYLAFDLIIIIDKSLDLGMCKLEWAHSIGALNNMYIKYYFTY